VVDDCRVCRSGIVHAKHVAIVGKYADFYRLFAVYCIAMGYGKKIADERNWYARKLPSYSRKRIAMAR
jgi:hypothetical protein